MFQRKTRILAMAGLVAAGIGAPAALAQNASQAAPLTAIYACADMTDGAARLACFDRAVTDLRARESNEGLAVVSREDIRKAETEAFGLQTPSLSAIAASAAPAGSAASATPPQPIDNVKMAVARVETDPRGRNLRFIMENGQVWRQKDQIRLTSIGKGPWTAEVRRGALGSFFLKLDNRPAVRAERVQ